MFVIDVNDSWPTVHFHNYEAGFAKRRPTSKQDPWPTSQPVAQQPTGQSMAQRPTLETDFTLGHG